MGKRHLEHNEFVHFDFAFSDIPTNSRQVLVDKFHNYFGGFSGQNLVENIPGK